MYASLNVECWISDPQLRETIRKNYSFQRIILACLRLLHFIETRDNIWQYMQWKAQLLSFGYKQKIKIIQHNFYFIVTGIWKLPSPPICGIIFLLQKFLLQAILSYVAGCKPRTVGYKRQDPLYKVLAANFPFCSHGVCDSEKQKKKCGTWYENGTSLSWCLRL